ncbi:MAG: hypothetical protein ABI461_21755, partial [Polyangiaceae bacterium]
MRKSIVIVGLGLVAVLGAGVIALPAYIQHRAIAEAAARGVTLAIEHTRLAFDGIHFEGIAATTVRVPNARIHADEVSATWDGAAVVATGGDVTIDGPITPPNESSEENPVPNAVGGPTSVHVQSAHISWTHCTGDATLDIKNVSGDFSLAPHIGDSFTWQGDTSVVWNSSTVGPLATQVTRDAKGDHARLSLDPANPAAETLG